MDGPVCCVSRILQAHLIISPVAAASFSVSFSMSASVRVSAADRKAARALLLALSDFSTASDALTRLFGGLADAPAAACERRFCVAAQLLRWQNLPAAAVSLADALVDFAAGDADDGGDREVVVTRGMVLTAMGKPALLFATSIYDDALAELVWAGLLALRRRLGAALDLARHALDNASDAHGYSALHYALEAQMHALALRVWRDLAQASSDQAGEHEAGTGSATNAVARLAASVVTQDVALPAGKKQIQGRNVSSGGATLLHFAARVDAPEELVRALLEGSPPAVAAAEDWDGNSPYRVALMRGNRFLADLLRQHSGERPVDDEDSAEAVAELRAARDERARVRYVNSMDPSAGCLEPHVFPALWSPDECARVLLEVERAAATRGWDKQRHAAYPTTDMPSYRVVPLDSWVRSAVADRLFPQVAAHFTLPASPGDADGRTIARQLSFRELFFVKYEARQGERAELPLHRDGSVLSFNILLNAADEFTGGGTFFEDSGRTVHITQGDAVVHSGKVRHAGASVLSGRRMILVGFLDVVDRVEWP